jgi:capsular polysaccharide biosynthesis protein
VYVAVFLAAGAAAYWWEMKTMRPERAAGRASATAFVHVRDRQTPQTQASAQPAHNGGPAAQPDLDAVRQAVLAEAGKRGAAEAQIEAVQSGPGDCKIAVTATCTAGQYADEAANSLAQAFADAYRAAWRSLQQQATQTARDAKTTADQSLREARSRLESVYERQLRVQQETLNTREAARVVPPPAPPQTENPEWAELNRQLSTLRERRTEALVQRTPLHPELLDLDARIQQVEQQLAATPRLVTAGLAPATPGAPAVEEMPAIAPKSVPQADSVELQTAKDAADRARHAAEEAAGAERRAEQQAQNEPAVELELARYEASASAPRSAMPQLMAALAAGLSTIAGLGMIVAGAAIEPRLATVHEVQTAVHVPVLAVLPQDRPSNRPRESAGRQRLLRAALMVLGVALMAGCVAVLLLMHGR